MYVTKAKIIITLIVVLLVAAQSGALAEGHKIREHPNTNDAAYPNADGPTHPYYTTEDLERIHNNTVMVTVMIQEADGDTWIYGKDNTTGDYYRALN